jgi:hypothetical protein
MNIKITIAILFVVGIITTVTFIAMYRPPVDNSNIDPGIDVQNPDFTCKEFKDKLKNYVVGEISVGFKPGVTLETAKKSVENMGAAVSKNDAILKGDIPIQNGVSFSLRVTVTPNQEQQFVAKFTQNPLVEFAEIQHCNNISPF